MITTQEQKPPQTPPLFTSSYLRVLSVQMAFGISYSSFLLLPKFLSTELSATAGQIGAMAGISLVGAAILSPLVGLFAPRLDRRLLLALALILEGVAALGFLFVTHIGWFSYGLRLLQGCAFILVFNCTATLVADQVPRRILARAVGFLGMAMLVTNALAPALTEPLAAAYGWKVVFALSGIVSLLSLVVIPGLRTPEEVSEPSVRDSAPALSRLPIHYGSFLIGAGIGVLFTFVQPYAIQQGATRVGDFFFGYVIAAVIVRGFFGGLADRIGPARVAAYALAAYACVTAAAAWSTPSTIVLIGAGLGVSHGFVYPALTAAGLGEVPARSRAVFMGWFACAFNVGSAFASLTLGPLADQLGYPPIFIAAGLLLATGVVPLLSRSSGRLRWARAVR